MGFPTSYGVRTLPLSVRIVAQKAIFLFWLKCEFNRIKSATKFFCVKISNSEVVVWPFAISLSNGPQILARSVTFNTKFSLKVTHP